MSRRVLENVCGANAVERCVVEILRARCRATALEKSGEQRRCQHPEGHEGNHSWRAEDGYVLLWGAGW